LLRQIYDQGYKSVGLLINFQQEYGIDLLGIVPDDTRWQSRKGGYDSTQFVIDWENQTATCPQGKQSCSWSIVQTKSKRPVVKISFGRLIVVIVQHVFIARIQSGKSVALLPCCRHTHIIKHNSLHVSINQLKNSKIILQSALALKEPYHRLLLL
jgi:hypothetical protein